MEERIEKLAWNYVKPGARVEAAKLRLLRKPESLNDSTLLTLVEDGEAVQASLETIAGRFEALALRIGV